MTAMITDKEADILRHTSDNGRYVTNEEFVIEMGKRGLLFDHGPQRLAGGMHYLVTTMKGREELNEWQRSQPKPKKKRRRSEVFDSWQNYMDACGRIPFSEFWKEIWPNYRTSTY